ncbi:hypothetical protein [Stenomitos frigidus]|uniref:Uncharacterized protein n=1 Tax=Stenomitos frigidus ULC18 TaxID=2107698 RepID=A0A2T1ELT0_9CYAN|nr:hypothetical protein [Stenomitos frigidus]PSB33684.1 hypothetical protein C7B82_04155 [Stenomitos frigidus ULC18]
MATSVQTPTLPPQACLPSSNQIALAPNQSTLPVAPTPSQLAGGDVVNLLIAIAVLVKVVLGKSKQ